MPELVFTFSGPEADAALWAPGESPMDAATGDAQQRTVTGQWKNRDGEPLAEAFPVTPAPPAFVEFPDDDGQISNERVPGALSFSADLPPDAAELEVSSDGMPVANIPVTATAFATALPQPVMFRIGEQNADFIVPVFAERFTNGGKFVAAVQQLHAYVLDQAPFDEPAVGRRLAFDTHFWSSDPVRGLFNTLDSNNTDGRLFYGDRERARRLLAPWIRGNTSLILIDSRLRGGAGGVPGYSAWTSITAKPNERWEAVCLHEVGHGLGLADEYLDSQRQNEFPSRLEPNVSRDPRPSRCPWVADVNVGDNPAPTAAIGHAAAQNAVGTFQGARYRTDLFRAAEKCLMKQTNQPFCAACKSHIRAKLTGA